MLPNVKVEEHVKKAGGETLSRELPETLKLIEAHEPTERINKTGAPDERDTKHKSSPVVVVSNKGDSGATYVV